VDACEARRHWYHFVSAVDQDEEQPGSKRLPDGDVGQLRQPLRLDEREAEQ
jgi:hypothetical protein